MTDNVENLILEHLRMLRGGQDCIEHELRGNRLASPASGETGGGEGLSRWFLTLALILFQRERGQRWGGG